MPIDARDADSSAAPRRVGLASLVGTTIEYYDFFIYGTAAALVFPALFFPDASAATGILLSFATFGVGFLARPLGGIVFGHYGDKLGRKRMLVISLVGMGGATVLMGLLPGYDRIGVLAPVLLTLLRMVQGVAVGGEWGGATLMSVEHAPAEKKGLFGSFSMMGAPLGTCIATLAFLAVGLLPQDQFLAWGWRLPFVFSALLLIVGLVVRLTVAESPAFAQVQREQAVARIPVVDALRRHWKEILLVAGTYLSQGVYAYIFVAYLVSYATTAVHIDRTYVLLSVCLAAVVATVLYPVFGRLSDRLGRKTVYLTGVLAMAAATGPAFAMIDSGEPLLFLSAQILVFGVAMAPAAGVTGSLVTLVFDVDVRYSGASIGYTLSQVAGSAFAPTIAAALYAATGTSTSLVLYLLAVSAVSVISVVLLPGSWGRAEAARQPAEDKAATAAGMVE